MVLDITDFLKKNNIVMLTIRQSWIVSIFGLLRTYYFQAIDNWLRYNIGKTFSIYGINTIFFKTIFFRLLLF